MGECWIGDCDSGVSPTNSLTNAELRLRVSHALRPDEQALLHGLVSRFRFSYVSVRLTANMLQKSAIDARTEIRFFLKEEGHIDFSQVLQGRENRVSREVRFVSNSRVERREVSFNRPRTKKGDPRIRIERLGAIARAGDAVIIASTGSELVLIHLSGSTRELVDRLIGILPPLEAGAEGQGATSPLPDIPQVSDGAVDLGEPPQRKEVVVRRVIRDTAMVRRLKAIHADTCQLCSLRLEVAGGEAYSEGHHLRPLGSPHDGPDIPENILILCPNCHAKLDFRGYSLEYASITQRARHRVAEEHVRYHNETLRS